MTTVWPKTMGQIAYEAYCADTGGVSLATGDKLPPWEELDRKIQHAWMFAAQAVVTEATGG